MDKLSFCAHRSTDVGICMEGLASETRNLSMDVGTGGVAYVDDFLVCRMHFPHDFTVGLGALICRYMEVWWSHMRSSFVRDAFDPGPTVSTRALTSRTEGWPRTTPIAKRSQKKMFRLTDKRRECGRQNDVGTEGQHNKQAIRRVGGTRPPGDRDLVTYQPTAIQITASAAAPLP